ASINADKRAVLDSLGLSQLGKLQIKNIIRNGVVLVLNNYDLSNHSVRLPGNRIWQLSASDYATVYGLPMGPEVVDLDDLTDDDAIEYANSVGLGGHVTENGQISWSALEAAIRHTDDPVLWGKLLFLLCIGCIFLPTTGRSVDCRFLKFLSGENYVEVFKSYNWCQYFVDCTTSGILHKDAANVSYLLADLLYLNVGYVHAYLNGDADVGAVNLYTWKELTDHISDIDEELEDIPIVRRRQGKRKRKSGGDGEAGTSKEELDVKGKKVKKLKVKVEDKLRKGKDVVKRVKGGIVDDSSTDFKKSVKKLKGWHTLDVNLGLISTKEIGESKKAEIHNLIEVCVGVLAAANQKLKDVDQHISTLQSSSSSSSTEESSPEASSTDSDDDESDGDGAKTKDAGGKDSDVQVIKSSSDSDFEEEMNPSDKRKRTKKVVTSKRDVSKGKGVANTRVVAQKKAFKKPSKDTRVSNVKKTLPAGTVATSSKKKDDGKITDEDDEDAEDEGTDDGKAGDDNDDKGGDNDHSEKDDGKGVDNTQATSSKKKDDGKITEEDDGKAAEDEGKDDGKDVDDEGKDKAVEDEGKDDGKAVEDNDSDEDDDNDKGGDDDHSDEDDDNDGGATATGDAVDPEGELNADANVNTPPRNIDSVVDERRTATTPSKNPDVLVDIGSLLCSPSVVNSVIEETVKQIATEHPPSPMVNAAAGGVQDSPIEKVTVRSTGCPGNLIEAADALVELNDPDTYSTDGRKNSMPETSSFSFSDFRAKIYQYATSKDLASDEILVKLKGSKILVRRNDMMTLLPNQDISIQTVDAYSDLLNRRSVHDGKASRWIFPQQFSELIFSQIKDSQTSPYDAAKEFKKFLHNEWSKKVDFSDVKLWFFPLCSQNHYVLFAIDHIQKRYVFFDTKDPKSFQRLYSHWCDKVSFFFTSYIDVIAQEKKVAARSYVNYKFKEIKKIQQRKDDNSSSGIFMLNICQYWEGLYQPSVSSSWKIEKHINERRESILLDMILDPSNYLMQKVIEKAGATPIQAEANKKQG
ncbi:hypothetical protein LINPERHAP1_LOCUS1650, partial [Linum perenne]